MPVGSRGLWAWALSSAGTGISREKLGRSCAPAMRNFLVCGLLLLSLPASASDINAYGTTSQACGRLSAGRCRASDHKSSASSAIPAFVSRWIAPGGGPTRRPSICSRGISCARPISMVSAPPRSGSDSSGDSTSQPRTQRTDARAILDDVNVSFQAAVSRGGADQKPRRAQVSTPVRRRGIGSGTAEARYSGRVSRAAAKSIAAAKRITLMHEQEFLNQDAVLRQATKLLLEGADDMAGGSRWGTGASDNTTRDQDKPGAKRLRRPYAKFTDEEESITDAMVEDKSDNFYDYSPDLESDWQAQKKAVAKPRGARGRWRSRLRSILPESDSSQYSVEEREHVVEVGRQREIANQELLRKVTMLAKGRAKSMSLVDYDEQEDVFLNPGFIDERRKRNELAAKAGALSSGVGLAELARRGLVGRSKSAQDLHRGDKAVEREVDLGGAVFDLKVVGNMMYSAGSDDSVSLYDTKSWDKVGELKGHEGWVNALAIDERRNLLYSASEDESVKVWDLNTLECVQTLPGHDSGALSLELVDTRLVVGCTGRILVWDTRSWVLLEKLSNHTQVLRAMSDGKQLSKNIGIDPRIAIAREASKLAGHKIGGLVGSSKHIFSAVDEGNIWVWDKRHLEVERKLLGPQDLNSDTVWVRSLELLSVATPGGKPSLKLLSGWADGALRVYDIATWTLEHTLTAHSGPILSLARVGDSIISTGADMTAAEWDPATWTLRRVLRSHDGAVCAVSALSDGRVITVSLDGKLKIWRGEDVLRGHPPTSQSGGKGGGSVDGGGGRRGGGGKGGGGGLGGGAVQVGAAATPASTARSGRGARKRGGRHKVESVQVGERSEPVSVFAEL